MDQVDTIITQWRAARPDLDVSTMGPLGRLFRVAKRASAIEEKDYASHELNTAGFDVLATLRRSGPPYALCAGDLMASMMITSGTMTNRIDQLEKAGLVRRNSDPNDARKAIVCLTQDGFEKIERAIGDHVATQQRILSGLSEAEIAQLDALLRQLARTIDG